MLIILIIQFPDRKKMDFQMEMRTFQFSIHF